MKIYKIEPAYLAGVADSDGSFSIVRSHVKKRKNPSYDAVFSLTWTDTPKTLAVMRYLKNTYGGYLSNPLNYKNKYPNSSPVRRYALEGKRLLKFLDEVEPFLKLKKAQANNCRLLLKSIRSDYKYSFKRKSSRLKKFQNNIWIKNKKLNSKNSGNRSKNAS